MATLAFPFAPTPLALLGRPDVNMTAAGVYDIITSFKNRRTGECFPKRQTIAQRLGLSVRTVSRAIAQLQAAGFLISRKLPLSNAYEVTTPDRWQPPQADAERRDKNGKSAGTKMASLPGQIWPDDGAASLYEPDVSYPDTDMLLLFEAEPALPETATTTTPGVGVIPEKPTPPATVAPPDSMHEDEAEKLVSELMPHHPWQGNRPRAIAAIQKVLGKDPEAADQIRRSHVAFRPHWEIQQAVSPKAFKPPLWQWVEEGNWKTEPAPPVDRKGAQTESWLERRRREKQEAEDSSYRTYAELGMWEAIRSYGGDEAVEVWREKIRQAS